MHWMMLPDLQEEVKKDDKKGNDNTEGAGLMERFKVVQKGLPRHRAKKYDVFAVNQAGDEFLLYDRDKEKFFWDYINMYRLATICDE